MSIDANILDNILANLPEQYYDQSCMIIRQGSFQNARFVEHKPCLPTEKERLHDNPKRYRKNVQQNLTSTLDKTFQQTMNKEKLLNLIPCPSEETSYLVRRHWRFSSKVKEQEWDAFSAAAVQHGAGAVAGATRPRREVKCIWIRKEETVYIPD